jgi:hypothetical protein
MNSSPHNFHIPVMGLAYTVDTPIKVARYGINSVISIIEDKLIELMRKHYYEQSKIPYQPIPASEEDYRAKRITDYLNLVNRIVKEQVEKLKQSSFEADSEIVKYFEMLPENSILRKVYLTMQSSKNEHEKQALVTYLQNQVQPGRIDVNIMTKVDKNNHDKAGNIRTESSDALAALRGYALSDLTNSAIIFSAGLNPRLFNYLEKLPGFNAKGLGKFDKKIIIKVSDYRSALIQGKYLAKKGIWVSEFRIESGLNCGGHAFATDGSLLGPILEEFKTKQEELRETLFKLYNASAQAKGIPVFDEPHPIKISVQGGIGTHEEATFLSSHYDIESTGWGTPFLLCPEATTVDDPTLQLLSQAREQDIMLSKSSPLGVRFNYLKGTSAEKERVARLNNGKPGSPCTEKHLVSNTEFTTEPICTASHTYQKKKIEQLQSLNLPAHEYEKQYQNVVSKECLCIGLSNSAILKYKLPPIKKLQAVTICPGPNIAYFNKVVSLREITDHIYGRTSILDGTERPHMFIKELVLNMNYLKEQIEEVKEVNEKIGKERISFCQNLLNGISYYRNLSESIVKQAKNVFLSQLQEYEKDVEILLEGIQLQLQPINATN